MTIYSSADVKLAVITHSHITAYMGQR